MVPLVKRSLVGWTILLLAAAACIVAFDSGGIRNFGYLLVVILFIPVAVAAFLAAGAVIIELVAEQQFTFMWRQQPPMSPLDLEEWAAAGFTPATAQSLKARGFSPYTAAIARGQLNDMWATVVDMPSVRADNLDAFVAALERKCGCGGGCIHAIRSAYESDAREDAVWACCKNCHGLQIVWSRAASPRHHPNQH